MSDKTIKYYKTNNPATLDAWKAYEAEDAEFIEQCEAIQQHFGAKQFLIIRSILTKSFAGLVFAESRDTGIWTKPDKYGIQKPRGISTVKKDVRGFHAELIDEYKSLLPTLMPNYDPVLKTIGLCWSEFVFGGNLKIFAEGDFFYCATYRPVADHLTEILASEFEAAEAAKPAKPE